MDLIHPRRAQHALPPTSSRRSAYLVSTVPTLRFVTISIKNYGMLPVIMVVWNVLPFRLVDIYQTTQLHVTEELDRVLSVWGGPEFLGIFVSSP
jgi:hypothetical protein